MKQKSYKYQHFEFQLDFFVGKVLKFKILKISPIPMFYLRKEFPHQSVPLSGLLVLVTVRPVVDPLEGVVELEDLGDLGDEVDGETLESVIAVHLLVRLGDHAVRRGHDGRHNESFVLQTFHDLRVALREVPCEVEALLLCPAANLPI